MKSLPEVTSVSTESYETALKKFAELLGGSHALKRDYPGYAYDGLPEQYKAPVLHALQEWVDFFSMHTMPNSISDKQLLWRFLGAFRLKPDGDFFSKIDDETCLEVVNRAGLQTFRSLSFMSVCSYTLDEVISVPWPNLYRRDEDITNSYINLQSTITDGTLTHRDLPGLIRVHEVVEISGFDKLATTIKPMYLSPVYDGTGAVVGGIHAFKILKCESLSPAQG
ncbi:hypothetical protein [Bdellovibrio sp. KM01]|uniref:hypothetical protein n=1 Tax=Bdellovibrio sp. KM01 TaxID=2748865 RepID=UPI0015E9DAE6|nr:hypothetical protein [Bdellovibrio sp. KM01]QLY24201.1 hypothetical protein HW988_12080 [Bdellovibrio sp. KM01]